MTPFKYNMTLKEYNRRRAILKALLQVYVDHRTIVEGGLSLVDVSTSLSWSRAQTEALVETLVSEGYLYSTHDTDHARAAQVGRRRVVGVELARGVLWLCRRRRGGER